MIRSTISHMIDRDTDDLDRSLFLDFDLAVLGQETKSKSIWCSNIASCYI